MGTAWALCFLRSKFVWHFPISARGGAGSLGHVILRQGCCSCLLAWSVWVSHRLLLTTALSRAHPYSPYCSSGVGHWKPSGWPGRTSAGRHVWLSVQRAGEIAGGEEDPRLCHAGWAPTAHAGGGREWPTAGGAEAPAARGPDIYGGKWGRRVYDNSLDSRA